MTNFVLTQLVLMGWDFEAEGIADSLNLAAWLANDIAAKRYLDHGIPTYWT